MPPPLTPQVNLLPSDEPQDVYAGVRSLVAQKISDDAEAEASDDAKAEGQRQLAMKLVGLITRKVVKQTVMTSVYGVTFIGAKRQIENRLHELADLKYEELPRAEQNLLSTYVARLTLDSLGEVRAGTLRSSLYNQTPPLPPYFPTAPLAAPSTCPLHSPLSRRVGLRSLVEDLFLQYAYPCPLLLVRVSLVILVRAVRLHLLISYGAGGLSNPRSLPRQALVVYDVLATKDEPRDLSLRRLLHIRHRLPLGEQVFDGGDRARVPADRHTNFP